MVEFNIYMSNESQSTCPNHTLKQKLYQHYVLFESNYELSIV